jgi:hypothetical protein
MMRKNRVCSISDHLRHPFHCVIVICTSRPQLANATNAQRAEYDALTRDAATARQRCEQLEHECASLARTVADQQAAAARLVAETAASEAERDQLESARAELGTRGGQRYSRIWSLQNSQHFKHRESSSSTSKRFRRVSI